jgi:LicD family
MLSMQRGPSHPSVMSMMDKIRDSGDCAQLPHTMESSIVSMEPDLVLLSHNDVDSLYDLMEEVLSVLDELNVVYFVTGGSLLGAIRSESILFNDNDVDIAVLDDSEDFSYKMEVLLPNALKRRGLSGAFGGIRILCHRQEHCTRIQYNEQHYFWIDLYTIKRYPRFEDLISVVTAFDKDENVREVLCSKLKKSIPNSSFPLFHFNNEKVLEKWPQRYIEEVELLPLKPSPFGPFMVYTPADSIGCLKRFFDSDCFTHYVLSQKTSQKMIELQKDRIGKKPLSEIHYLPVQHSRRGRVTMHSRQVFLRTLALYDSQNQAVKNAPGLSHHNSCDNSFGLVRTRSLFNFDRRINQPRDLNLSPTSVTDELPKEPLPKKLFAFDIRNHIGESAEPPIFDVRLREVMEPHIAAARRDREECRDPCAIMSDPSIASKVGVPYIALRDERRFLFDGFSHPLHRILAETLGVEDLSLLHKHQIQDKKKLLAPLLNLENRRRFHECYDNFVTLFCIPLLHSLLMAKNQLQNVPRSKAQEVKYRYQAFPCIRVVRPGETSIDPHCDTSYGYSIGSLNFHIPLTPTFGTNALFAESHPGREDWHGFYTKSPGLGFLFDGARCIHFTLENSTDFTRVSIDFRIAIYLDGENCDVLSSKRQLVDRYSSAGPGFYEETSIAIGIGSFSFPEDFHDRIGVKRLCAPDARVGFPFS